MAMKRFRAVIGGDDRSPAWQVMGNVSPTSVGNAWLVPSEFTASSTNWTPPADAAGAGWIFYLRSGFSTVADMPPSIEQKMMQIVAHIYENREAMVGTSIRVDPLLTQGLMTTLWIPRC